jgi:YD repeat-containing protein
MEETSSSVPTPDSHNYTYDVLNRLLNATHPQVENPAESFTYDAVGNRLISHLSTTYRYDTANRLLEDDTYLYAYDNNGNLIEKFEKSTSNTTRYFYDTENQLIAITLPNGDLAEYRYDGLGRRVEKFITPVSGPVVITRCIYDSEDILFEYDATNTMIARYTHGPCIDEPLIMNRGGQDYFYHMYQF